MLYSDWVFVIFPDMLLPLKLKKIALPHKILRAATFENMAEPDGRTGEKHAELYERLSREEAGTIITGFTYISRQGRAMQPFQAGIDGEDKVEAWKRVVDRAKKANSSTRMILQIAHTGRQTIREVTGKAVVGAGPVRCTYFLSRVRTLRENEVSKQVGDFATAVKRAEKAGFDAVQIHAAHGYLIHQFLSPHTNRRSDIYGSDRVRFLREILRESRRISSLPIILKMSASEDRPGGINPGLTASYIREIEKLDIVDAIEISYGTMEIAFNIIRGGHPADPVLKYNRLFMRFGRIFTALFKPLILPWYQKRFIKYTDLYNLENAAFLKKRTGIPILVTGGIRSASQIKMILEKMGIDGVTLCRPFVCEPDIVKRFRDSPVARSSCTNCNMCTVMSDSPFPLQCYLVRK